VCGCVSVATEYVLFAKYSPRTHTTRTRVGMWMYKEHVSMYVYLYIYMYVDESESQQNHVAAFSFHVSCIKLVATRHLNHTQRFCQVFHPFLRDSVRSLYSCCLLPLFVHYPECVCLCTASHVASEKFLSPVLQVRCVSGSFFL